MADGKVQAVGTHAALLQSSPAYAALLRAAAWQA
jgi:hypothetical protein